MECHDDPSPSQWLGSAGAGHRVAIMMVTERLGAGPGDPSRRDRDSDRMTKSESPSLTSSTVTRSRPLGIQVHGPATVTQ